MITFIFISWWRFINSNLNALIFSIFLKQRSSLELKFLLAALVLYRGHDGFVDSLDLFRYFYIIGCRVILHYFFSALAFTQDLFWYSWKFMSKVTIKINSIIYIVEWIIKCRLTIFMRNRLDSIYLWFHNIF